MTNQRVIEVVEEFIQKRFNKILENNEQENFDKLPGLVEALKIIKEMEFDK
ncbi:hypothetical protein H1D32_11615 [Anaerobacillus sp. CMMVII]|uniref:hypothetical protein n=1 Tax=Anaerobacillus sp. CMMVII TaxID=2755588 RepID=UPI0021B70B89|nr:hypothetical protein [Anaerobacillus sp. CMMVII]MCT8138340.1 hypothetical protein [Anaerobacillus sp. CMMVII]